MTNKPVNYSIVKIMSFFLFIIVFLVILVFVKGNYTYTTTVVGFVVDPSITKITTTTTGQVISVIKRQSSGKGEPLITIVSDNSENIENIHLSNKVTITELSKLITIAEQRREHERKAHEKHKIYLTQAIESVSKEIAVNLNTLDTLLDTSNKTKEILKSSQDLFDQGHLSQSELAMKRIELNKANTNIDQIRAALIILENKKLDYYNQLDSSINSALKTESQLTEQIFQYKRNLKEFSERYYHSITSPISLSDINPLVEVGEQVISGDVILVGRRATNTKTYLQYKVSQNSIGYVQLRDSLIIRVTAFPYEKFGVITGKVINISEFSSLDRNQRLNHSNDGFYYMDVEIIPSKRIPLSALKDGMHVEAVIKLQKMNLIEWLFLPINKSLIRNPEF